jgi:hypothetical protein
MLPNASTNASPHFILPLGSAGLYPEFSFATDGAKFGPYMSQFDYKG